MIVLLGASGYIGQAFQKELQRRGEAFIPVSRSNLDYTRYDRLVQFLRNTRPAFLINAAGYTGRPNVDACESARADTLHGNTLLPITISHACQAVGISWGHVSSGCIYAGAKIVENGVTRVESDLTQSGVKELVDQHSPVIQGFAEEDTPNFSFRHPPCSFYSGSKALAEEALSEDARVYIWRLRIPFDEQDNPRNYLTKLQKYAKVYENFNSLSHRRDSTNACLDLYHANAPFGTYNVTNPGYVSTRQVVQLIEKLICPERRFDYWSSDDEFYRSAAKTPRSNCILDVKKLLATGVAIRPVEDALVDALVNWQPDAGRDRAKDRQSEPTC